MPSKSGEPIRRAREMFFEYGSNPETLVPRTILASWQRCRQRGLAAEKLYGPVPVEQHALREQQERHETLRQASRPELEALQVAANQADSIVILAAPDGFILDTVGNVGFLAKAARVSLQPGVLWNESVIGTNAIGTALVEHRATEVRGGEHYHLLHNGLTCSATPIFDPHGDVAGVLDLTGAAARQQALALGVVQLSAEQIERRLFEGAFAPGEIIHIHPDADSLGNHREGLLVFEDHKVVAANRFALEILGFGWDQLGTLRKRELFNSALPKDRDPVPLRCRNGSILYARRGGAEATMERISVAPGSRRDTPRRPQATTFVVSPELEVQIRQAVKLLDADIPILLQGETGTGKEVVARELHRRSTRGRGSFVAVNCAALPEGLIESELFGYASGAFTGARREGRPGLLHQANGGTLFLDEIGDMALGLQTRLLRVLQEREVTPLGASTPEPIDIAVVAATHQDIETAVAAGRFRADLYYRIAQSVLELPPLRKRPDRSSLISELWSALGGQDIPMDLHPAVIRKLASLPWPGNVRQLVGTLRSLMVLGPPGGTIGEADLPLHLKNLAPRFDRPSSRETLQDSAPPAQSDLPQSDLRAIESRAIDDAIASCNGNVAAAARKLGISRSTIYRRLTTADKEP